ncbi:MAG: membrane protein insertase YidC [Nitrospinota bacterium]
MDSKAFTAIVLMFVVIVLWNIYYYYRYQDQLVPVEGRQEQAVLEKEAAPITVETEVPARETEKKEISARGVLDPLAAGTEEKAAVITSDANSILVDTGVAWITLSRIGGTISSLKLLEFTNEKGRPVEMVRNDTDALPLSLEFATEEATKKINGSLFNTTAGDRITLGPKLPVASVEFDFELETGFKLKKKLIFHHGSYRIDMEVALSHSGMNVTGSTFGLTWPGLGNDAESFYSYKGPLVLIDGKRIEKQPDEDETLSYDGKVLWAGLSSRYYSALFLPDAEKTKVTSKLIGEKVYSTTIQMVSLGENTKNRLSIYVGPKRYGELKQEGKEMNRVIYYGWFDIIAKPLFRLLMWFYSYLGNFGWAIIFLTVVVKTLFWPLTQKSFMSMQKMKKLQPQMKIIQERYKKDKTKMNEELIALYKKYKVNPMSGCMPMLLQIPVFIALYKVLLESIELKGAPFILWITDLSLKDPYYITPLVMGASMFLQQKLSPAAGDPMQRNMMLAMPIVFTVMFLNFPSGLVIYWLVNNILSIIQQYFIHRKSEQEA